MRIVVHQPYFLPWMGFFAKLAWCDGFVLLDNAQFRKRHYHDRVQVLNMHGDIDWLSVPTGQNLGLEIRHVHARATGFVVRMKRTLAYSYVKARAFKETWSIVSEWLNTIDETATLSEINSKLIEKIEKAIMPDHRIPHWNASELGVCGTATNKLIGLAESVGATEIVVGGGSSLLPQVHDLEALRKRGLAVYVQNYAEAGIVYPQLRRSRAGFVGGLSIVDYILNVGVSQAFGTLRCERLAPRRVI